MGEERSEHNEGRNWENVKFSIPTAGTEVTIWVNNDPSGNPETATNIILGKTGLGTGFNLRPNKAIIIKEIQGQVFRDPITVSTAGASASKHLRDFNKIVIESTIDTTDVELTIT